MPAGDSYTWLGTFSTDASNINNWLVTSNFQPGDPPPPPPTLPDGDDEVAFGSMAQRDCVGLTSTSGSFASLVIAQDFTHTVSLGADLSVGTFLLAGGAISQPTSGTDLTVTGSFTWTGGTLNSSSNVGTVTIAGATGSIAPTNGGTVSLGSDISLENAATVTALAGTIELLNEGLQMNIYDQCGLIIDAGESLDLSIQGNVTTGAATQIFQGGSVALNSGSWLNNKGMVSNQGGTFTLKPNTTAHLSGVGGTPAAYSQSSGSAYIHEGATLQTGNLSAAGIQITGGALRTVGAGNEDGSWATIDTSALEVAGTAEVFINFGPTEPFPGHHDYGTLRVVGNVVWSGGSYHPFLQGDHDFGPSDLWYATGTFTVNQQAELSPSALDSEWIAMMPTSGYQWEVIEATGGITSNNNAPSYDTNIWQIVPEQGNPVRKWYLKAV